MAADASTKPSGGTLAVYEPPSGPGIRVDGYGYSGYTTSPSFDSLLAKLIVHADADFAGVLRRAYRALCEFRLEGVASNLAFLRNLVLHPAVQANQVNTRFIEDHAASLVAEAEHQDLFFSQSASNAGAQQQIDLSLIHI